MKRMAYVVMVVLAFASGVYALEVEDYMPMEIGYRWTFQVSSDEGIDTSYEEVIYDTTMFGYFTYAFYEGDADSGDTVYRQIREGDGLYFMMQFDEESDIYMPAKMAPDPFNIGDAWEIMTFDSSWTEAPYEYFFHIEMHGTMDALEDIIVPAGIFNDCVKLHMEGQCSVVASVSGMPIFSYVGPINRNIVWIGYQMGPVQSHETQFDIMSGDSSTEYSVLIDYNFSGIEEKHTGKPAAILLSTYPNPFNSSCAIAAPENAEIEICDLRGKQIDNFQLTIDNSQPAARAFIWTPDESIPSGIYLVRATTVGGQTVSGRLVYLK